MFCKATGGNPAQDVADGQRGGQRYAGGVSLKHPLVSPVYARHLGGLPPLHVSVGDAELMRDEAVTLARRVQRESEPGSSWPAAELKIWPRMWHVFPMYQEGYGKGPLAPALDAVRECAAFLRRIRT